MGEKLLEKVFSIKNDKDGRHKVVRVLGAKVKLQYDHQKRETQKAILVQDSYNLNCYNAADKIVVFIEIEPYRMCGGQMSLFSLCKFSKEILEPSVPVLITTMPGKYTYAHNNNFENNLNIMRWEQIAKIIKNKKEVILHIPEVCIKNPETGELLFDRLTEHDYEVLKSIEKLQINILNQNIELIPDNDILDSLKKITENITQTVAHDKTCNQSLANKYNMPVHLFSGFYELPDVKKYSLSEKENLILFSPDLPTNGLKYKEEFIKKIIKSFPNYRIERIFGYSFEDYCALTARAKFVISFGEGFDGYFNNSPLLGTMGLAVFNRKFFPDDGWLQNPNVYDSFEQMSEKIVADMKYYLENPAEYYSVIKNHRSKVYSLYSKEKTKKKLNDFYNKNYDFLPFFGEEKQDNFVNLNTGIIDYLPNSFKNYLLENNMPEKINKLKRNLDKNSLKVIDSSLKKILNVPDSRYSTLYFVKKEEFEAEFKDKNSIYDKIMTNDMYNFFAENYKLSKMDYDLEVLVFHHSLKDTTDKLKEYIKNKDYIDAGAYIGDSALVLFPYQPRKIYSFEISPYNLAKYQKTMELNNIETDKYELINMGLSDKNDVIKIKDSKDAGVSEYCSSNDCIAVKFIPLDKFVFLHSLEVGFIKADIEGSALKALMGMTKTIKTFRPVLSLSIYHSPEEFFETKPYLEEIVSDLNYEIEIRNEVSLPDNLFGVTVFVYPAELK